MAWMAVPAIASMTKKADLSPGKHLTGKNSWEDQIEQGGMMMKDTSGEA